MKKKKIIPLGTFFKRNNVWLKTEEFFVADGIRWFRCSFQRKTGYVKYYGLARSYKDFENVYLTETECLQLHKKGLL